MSPRCHRFSLVGMTFLAVALLAAGAVRADKTLRYKFKKGDKTPYVTVQEMVTVADFGGVKFKTTVKQTMDLRLDVKDVNAKGEAEIEQTFTRIQMKLDVLGSSIEYDSSSGKEPEGVAAQFAPIFKALTKSPFKFKMNDRGEVIDVKVPDEVAKAIKETPGSGQFGEGFSKEAIEQMVRQSSPAFPEGALAKGKSWTQKVEIKNPASGKQTIQITYTYEGEKNKDGKTLDKIGVSMKMDFGEIKGPSGETVNVKDTKASGALYFDSELGRLHESSLKQTMKSQIKSAGKLIDQEVETTVTNKLAGEKKK